MALDKAKVATLVRMQAPMPMVKKPMLSKNPNDGQLKKSAPSAAAAKPGVGQKIDPDTLTPQEIADLAEQAAQEAEAGQDPDIEDALAGYDPNADMTQAPPWATDQNLWHEAVEGVGVGTPTADRYDEPMAVVAYLYKKFGGPIAGAGGAEQAAPQGAHGDKPVGPPAAAGAKSGVAPAAPKPPTGAKPMPKPGAPAAPAGGAGDELKQMLDQAAQEAQSSPDPQIMSKLQAEPPQPGQPPSWAVDADKWQKAEAAVEPHKAEYPDPGLVIAHVYLKMGGTLAP